MAPFDEPVDEFCRFVRCLRAQQADAQVRRRQAVLFRRTEARVEGIDHRPGPPVPGIPVRRVDNDVGISGAIRGEALAEGIGKLEQTVRRVCEPAGPVEKMQEIGEPFELQQAFARPRHRHARFNSPFLQRGRLERTLEMNVYLCLGQGAH